MQQLRRGRGRCYFGADVEMDEDNEDEYNDSTDGGDSAEDADSEEESYE